MQKSLQKKARVANVFLSLYIGLLIAPVIMIDRLSIEDQWIFWDMLNISRPLLLIGALYLGAANITTKVLSCFAGMLTAWLLADFLLLTFAEGLTSEIIIRNVTASLFLALSLFISGNLYFSGSKKLASDKYSKKGTFLVNSGPRFWAEIFASFFKMPFGRQKLVIESREFCFKKRIFSENEHVFDGKSNYSRIENIPLERARAFIGTRWSVFSNCYRIIKRIRNGR